MLKTMLKMWKTHCNKAFLGVELLKLKKLKRKFLYIKFTPLSTLRCISLDFFASRFILYIMHTANTNTECFLFYDKSYPSYLQLL